MKCITYVDNPCRSLDTDLFIWKSLVGGDRVQHICILLFIIRTAVGVCSLNSVGVSMEQLQLVSTGTVLQVNTTVCQYWIVNSLHCLYFAAVIEHVRDGCTVRAFLLPKFDYVTVMLSGVKVRVLWMDFFFFKFCYTKSYQFQDGCLRSRPPAVSLLCCSWCETTQECMQKCLTSEWHLWSRARLPVFCEAENMPNLSKNCNCGLSQKRWTGEIVFITTEPELAANLHPSSLEKKNGGFHFYFCDLFFWALFVLMEQLIRCHEYTAVHPFFSPSHSSPVVS